MSNPTIDAFFKAADAKLSTQNRIKFEPRKTPPAIDNALDNKERWERSNQVLAAFSELAGTLNEWEALLASPASANRAAKLEAINKRLEILNAPLDANTDTEATMRALNIEAIRKKTEGQDEDGPTTNLETVG
jgi:hypothetical protein